VEDKLKAYLQTEGEGPPFISEKQIFETMEKRRKRFSIMMLSIAAALWSVLLYGAALWVGSKINQGIAVLMLLGLSIGYICSGCFAGIVVKFGKFSF
jgi:hypothetical protein